MGSGRAKRMFTDYGLIHHKCQIARAFVQQVLKCVVLKIYHIEGIFDRQQKIMLIYIFDFVNIYVMYVDKRERQRRSLIAL